MMKKRRNVPFDKKLMSEEAKKFKQLLEYTFYVEGDDDDDDAELLLGEEGEEEDVEAEPGDGIEDEAGELGIDPDEMSGADELGPDAGLDNEVDPDADIDPNGDFDEELPEDPMAGGEEITVDEPEEEVDVDVTQLVQSTEDAKASADEASAKTDQLMNMLGKLESQVASMDAVKNQIDNLENSLEKRMPTPAEKLELRSKDSYPYSLKLGDYWEDQTGQYDVMNTDTDGEGKPKEYVLTQDDVDEDYQESRVKDSLNGKPDDEDEYDEETIY